jgi:hypothetical protein
MKTKKSKTEPVQMPKFDNIMEQIQANQLKKADMVKLNAKALFDTLSRTRVAIIEVTFDGCGDSGQVEEVDCSDAKGKGMGEAPLKKIVKGSLEDRSCHWDSKKGEMVERSSGEGNVRAIVEQICYDKLSANHGGWEINEGSYGTFRFDVAGRKVTLEYNERVEDVRTSEESF